MNVSHKLVHWVAVALLSILCLFHEFRANAQAIDGGNVEVGKAIRWTANIGLASLRVRGCSAECEIDSVELTTVGPGEVTSINTDVRRGKILPFSDIPISGVSAPRNTGNYTFIVKITGGCAVHNHPHKTVSASITWHGTAPPIQVRILSAVMRDTYTFDVHLYRNFGGRNLPVRLQYEVNGVPIDISANRGDSGQLYGFEGAYTSDPISFAFLNVVPKFKSAQSFTVNAIVKIKDWSIQAQKQVYIPLPTVIVPGAAPFLVDSTVGGNTTFPALEDKIIDAVRIKNDGIVDPDSMVFQDEQLVRLPGQATSTSPFYPVVQTVDFHNAGFDRNTCTLGQGGELVNRTIKALLQNTWASKVNIISHSKGCLTARAAFSQEATLRSTVASMVMIEGPHAGMVYTFDKDILNTLLGGYFDNLLPTAYNSYMDVGRSKFAAWPTTNGELARLNSRSLPDGPNYVIYYSDMDHQTPWAVNANSYTKNIYGDGDGRVPVFSQKGLTFDANAPRQPFVTLFSFKSVTVHYRSVPGTPSSTAHGNTMTNPDFIQDLVGWLYN